MRVVGLFFAILGLTVAKFEAAKEEGGVLVLDESNFDAVLAENANGIMVEFYAPWCGHCKKLAPEYKKAAAALKKEDPPVHLAMVDATEEKSLAEKFGIRGFPTLKFFRNGEPVDYEGGRTERDIISFMKKKTGPPSKLLGDAAEIKKAKDSNDVIVAGFFQDMESDAAKLFLEVASKTDDFDFFHTDSIDIIEDAQPNTVVLFKSFDEGRNDLTITESTTVAEIAEFVVKNSLPKVMEFSQERSQQIFRGPVKVHMLTFVDTKAAYFSDIKETLETIADHNRGKILHIYVPASEDRVMSYFGFKKEELPKTVIADMGGEGALKKYLFEGKEHTAEALLKLENDFFDGAISPTLKSEDDKPSHMKGPVKVITGKTFEQNVLNNNKDTLLEFYAPWCGHCKSLAPKYDQLGEKFEKVDSVMIAKMDATANEIDHPAVNVRGFPTLYYFPANGEPVLYDGGREVDDFVKYLQAHATQDFELDDGVKGGPSAKDEL